MSQQDQQLSSRTNIIFNLDIELFEETNKRTQLSNSLKSTGSRAAVDKEGFTLCIQIGTFRPNYACFRVTICDEKKKQDGISEIALLTRQI